MDVFEAVASRYSCRAFLPTPVPHIIIREIVERAARAPSAGNMQPWRVYAIAGQRVEQFKALLALRMATDLPKGEGTDYTIYPEPEPYRSRRFTVGELLYRSINLSREDKSSRYKQYSRNYQFLAPRLSYFSHAKRLTDLHNACFSATSRQFDDLFGYGPWVRRCGRPNQFLALSARACRRFCVVRRLRLLAETAF